MRVVDTSAWIEWLRKSPTGAIVAQNLPGLQEWLVPTIVQFELAKWAFREKGSEGLEGVAATFGQRLVAPLDTKIALHAAEAARLHKLSTADAIIYATALLHNADLLTCDAHFEGLERVVMVGKGEG